MQSSREKSKIPSSKIDFTEHNEQVDASSGVCQSFCRVRNNMKFLEHHLLVSITQLENTTRLLDATKEGLFFDSYNTRGSDYDSIFVQLPEPSNEWKTRDVDARQKLLDVQIGSLKDILFKLAHQDSTDSFYSNTHQDSASNSVRLLSHLKNVIRDKIKAEDTEISRLKTTVNAMMYSDPAERMLKTETPHRRRLQVCPLFVFLSLVKLTAEI